MKVTQAQTFKPITIVLETEEEARLLQTIAGNVVGQPVSGRLRPFTNRIYKELEHLGIFSYPYNGPQLNSDDVEVH